MFRLTMCPSSGDTTVFMRHLVLVILCGKLSGMQEHMLLHTRQSSTQNNKNQVSHKHSCISWWWAHSQTKHVEIDKYKYTKKKCAPSWFYLQDYRERCTVNKTENACFGMGKWKTWQIIAWNFALQYINKFIFCVRNFHCKQKTYNMMTLKILEIILTNVVHRKSLSK